MHWCEHSWPLKVMCDLLSSNATRKKQDMLLQHVLLLVTFLLYKKHCCRVCDQCVKLPGYEQGGLVKKREREDKCRQETEIV